MNEDGTQFVLGSQSPRRRELMSAIVDASCLRVLPPDSDDEAGFDGLIDIDAIELRLRQVVETKYDNVAKQLNTEKDQVRRCIVCADTIVVANQPDGRLVVLGKPPGENWEPVVKRWFTDLYADSRHEVWTGCRISYGDDDEWLIVRTGVRMGRLDEAIVDWYLSTGESVGKAGGYGIQGQASVLVAGLDGSLSNVIGLPVLEVRDVLKRLDVL